MKNCEACKTAEKHLELNGGSKEWIFLLLLLLTAVQALLGYLLHVRPPREGYLMAAALLGFGAFSTFTLSILKFVFVGQYSWHYKDADGDPHQHLDKPDGEWPLILRLRHGGVFRKPLMIRNGRPDGAWILRNWNGAKDVEIHDVYGGRLRHDSKEILALASYTAVYSIVEAAQLSGELAMENGELKRKVTGLFHDIDSLLLFVEGVADTLSKKPRWSNADRAIADVYNALLARGTNPERGSWLKKYLKGRALPLVLPEPKKRNLTEVPAEVETASQAVPPS